MKGSRVQAVVQEMQGEKIDIIPWSPDTATFVVNALQPANVARVLIDEEEDRIEVVVPDDQLMPTAREYAEKLANGPKALSLIRQAAWASLDNDWSEQVALERRLQRDAGRTADFREGVVAFLQKRPANFTGS